MSDTKRVAVIGAGVIGLSSAVLIKEQLPNVHVTLLADKFSPNTTGDGSAGLWSPYLLGDVKEDTLKFWCSKTIEFLRDIYLSAEATEYGVGLISSYYIFSKPKEISELEKDVFIDCRYMTEKELSLFPQRFKYGARFTSYYTECTKLLSMLLKKFKEQGGLVIEKKINNISDLIGQYDAVVNCTGLGALKFVPDSKVTPIRGQVFRVEAPWIKHVVIADEEFYIIPNSNEVICGGTHQEGDWNINPNPIDSNNIWKGCTELIPSLKKAKVIREWVGLRPGRCSPRLERETRSSERGTLEVIHNYGHGGSGVTLFWGCAHHTLMLLQDALSGIPFSKL